MLALIVVVMAIIQQQAETPRDYTAMFVGIGLFMLGQLILGLLWGGRITAQIASVKELMGDVPKRGDVRAEIAQMQAELLKYVNERTKPEDSALHSAIAELNRKIDSIQKK